MNWKNVLTLLFYTIRRSFFCSLFFAVVIGFIGTMSPEITFIALATHVFQIIFSAMLIMEVIGCLYAIITYPIHKGRNICDGGIE